MKTLLLRLVLATMCMVAAASANAQAGDWGNFVFVSSTLGNNANKLCLGEGLRGSDIGCPTYAPTVLPGGYVGIGNNTPTVALSVNGEVQVSSSSVACSGSTKGSIRYSTSSNTLEYCNSSAWTGVTNSTDASLTAFTVTKTATQSLATVGTVVTWEAASTNNGNAFNLATERFVAPANGFYFFIFTAINTGDISFTDYLIHKNGVSTGLRSFGGSSPDTYNAATAQGVVYLAAGDYIDVRANNTSQTLFGTTGQSVTTFSGFLLNAGSGTSSGGSGVSAMASLTDVQLTNLAARDYLHYDQPSGKWVNISASTVMSTTTMVTNWPDAIICGYSGSPAIAMLMYHGFSLPGSQQIYYYAGNNSYTVTFNDNGTYNSSASVASTGAYPCGSSYPVSALYTAGRAFNFIGSANTSSTALGDRITSGTSAVTVNSATSIISLTTGGVDWGYLNSGLSYLPRLNAANVSASYVSSTLTQVSGTSLACTTALKGSIRYSNTSNTLEYCNSTAWAAVINSSDASLTAFTATKTSVQSGVANGAVITWEATTANNGNAFDLSSERFTAPANGFYFVIATLLTNADSSAGDFVIYKNGAVTALRGLGTAGATSYKPSMAQGVLYLAAGDYVDVRSNQASQTFFGNVSGAVSTFSGFLLNAGSGASSGGSGVSAIASLTDVQLTNLAGRDYLRYDQPTGKWVNISESMVMSTTTMFAGLPDAVECVNGPSRLMLYYNNRDTSANTVAYRYIFNGNTTDFRIIFNTSGTYNSQTNLTGYSCENKTIAQLYATGQAFNFIGASSNALGDRITSGTSAVTVNSATSYISLTTGGVDWGYLNSGLSYLPRLNAANVSASYVSSTITQVSGTSLACTTVLKGSIRYSSTSNTLEYCNSTAWVSAGPSGTVVPAFSVNKNGATQTVVAGTNKISFANVVYDNNNNFVACTTNCNSGAQTAGQSRFTPTIPGRYIITLNAGATSTGSTDYIAPVIAKNGVQIKFTSTISSSPGQGLVGIVTAIVDMNGTTDYIEGMLGSNLTSITGTTNITSMEGILISMAGGNSGGSAATPAGVSGSIQFNSAGALAGRSDIIVDPSGSVGIGTGSPKAALDVSGTVKMAGTGAEACVSNTLGTFRFNPINGVPQICR